MAANEEQRDKRTCLEGLLLPRSLKVLNCAFKLNSVKMQMFLVDLKT